MDSFYVYMKKQLLAYVEAEHKKGIPLETIENTLLNAGHDKNLVDEVFSEIKKELEGKKTQQPKDEIKKDIEVPLKESIFSFFGNKKLKTEKEKEAIKQEFKEVEKKSDELVKEVIEEAEIIEEKTTFEGIAFFIYLVIMALIIILIAGYSNSEIVNVFFGFLPTIINAFVSFFLLFLADNLALYVMIPLAISSIFFAIGKFANFSLFSNMQIEPLASINFLFSFIFNVYISYIRFLKPNHMKKRVIKSKQNNKEQKEKTEKENIQEKKEIEKNNEIKKETNQEKTITNQVNHQIINQTLAQQNLTEPYLKKERPEIKELKNEFGLK
ncbi:MAG: hypothetical protein QW757_00550 [Candidatus Woesearchaeota archaeon]